MNFLAMLFAPGLGACLIERLHRRSRCGLLVVGLCFAATAAAQITRVVETTAQQPGAIEGVVRRSSVQRPVAGAMVRLPDTAMAAETDTQGRFHLGPLSPGTYALALTAPGLRSLRIIDVVVKPGQTFDLGGLEMPLATTEEGVQPLEEIVVNADQITMGPVSNLRLDGATVSLSQVVVTPSRFGIAEERIATNATLTNAELETLPQLGEDLYRTIERLPGLSSNELSAKFLVRGAPNSQMLARFDGVDLIEPFHLKDWDGTLSIVDLQTIGSVDLVTGGFTTDYGDRLAGVMTMETQEFTRSQSLTTLGLSVTNMRATNQGAFADGNGQWMVAARRGYIDLAVKLGGGTLNASPTYYDFSGKVEYRLSPQQSLSLHVLYAADTFQRPQKNDNDPDLRRSYDSAYLWGRWQGHFGERLSGEAVLSLSQLDWHRDGNGLLDDGVHRFMLHDDRRLDTVGLRQDWTLNLTEHALVRSGFEFKSGEARYDYALLRDLWTLSNGNLFTSTRTVNYSLRPDGDYTAAYAALRLQPWSPLVIEPGVRFERHSYTNDSGWSPRFNASLALGPRTTVRAAWGIYEQAQGLQELSLADRETKFSPSERAE